MSIKDIFHNLFGHKQPRNRYNEIEVLFYKGCLRVGEHGQIVVSHKKFGLVEAAVPFVFPGLTEAPHLTARLMHDLWSAAESQGYIPHYIQFYGTLAEVVIGNSDFSQDPELDATHSLNKMARDQYVFTSSEERDTILRSQANRVPAMHRKVMVPQDQPRNLSTGEPVPSNWGNSASLRAEMLNADLPSKKQIELREDEELMDEFFAVHMKPEYNARLERLNSAQQEELKIRVALCINNRNREHTLGLRNAIIDANAVVEQFILSLATDASVSSTDMKPATGEIHLKYRNGATPPSSH